MLRSEYMVPVVHHKSPTKYCPHPPLLLCYYILPTTILFIIIISFFFPPHFFLQNFLFTQNKYIIF